MKNRNTLLCIVALILAISFSCSTVEEGEHVNQDVKRVGMVIKIKPEYIEEYKAVHSDSNAGVRDLLIKANMRNFSIFMHQLDDGNWYEFGYYEYTGNDGWAEMEQVYFNR